MFFGFALLYIPFHLKFKGAISRQALKHKITKAFINASMLLSMMTVESMFLCMSIMLVITRSLIMIMMRMIMWILRGRSGFSNQSTKEHQRREHLRSYSLIASY